MFLDNLAQEQVSVVSNLVLDYALDHVTESQAFRGEGAFWVAFSECGAQELNFSVELKECKLVVRTSLCTLIQASELEPQYCELAVKMMKHPASPAVEPYVGGELLINMILQYSNKVNFFWK